MTLYAALERAQGRLLCFFMYNRATWKAVLSLLIWATTAAADDGEKAKLIASAFAVLNALAQDPEMVVVSTEELQQDQQDDPPTGSHAPAAQTSVHPRLCIVESELRHLVTLPVPAYFSLQSAHAALCRPRAVPSLEADVFLAWTLEHALPGSREVVAKQLTLRISALYDVVSALYGLLGSQARSGALPSDASPSASPVTLGTPLRAAPVVMSGTLRLESATLQRCYFMAKFEAVQRVQRLRSVRLMSAFARAVDEKSVLLRFEGKAAKPGGDAGASSAGNAAFLQPVFGARAEQARGDSTRGGCVSLFPLACKDLCKWRRYARGAGIPGLERHGAGKPVETQTGQAGRAGHGPGIGVDCPGSRRRVPARAQHVSQREARPAGRHVPPLSSAHRHDHVAHLEHIRSLSSQREACGAVLALLHDPMGRWGSQVDRIPGPIPEIAALGVLTASQEEVLRNMITQRMQVVFGPPGSGKTFFCANALVRMLAMYKAQNLPLRICVVAPTHAAVNGLLRHVRTMSQACFGEDVHVAKVGSKGQEVMDVDQDRIGWTLWTRARATRGATLHLRTTSERAWRDSVGHGHVCQEGRSVQDCQ